MCVCVSLIGHALLKLQRQIDMERADAVAVSDIKEFEGFSSVLSFWRFTTFPSNLRPGLFPCYPYMCQ
jgi:hypothetical protein